MMAVPVLFLLRQIQATDAISYLHNHRPMMIHRDIKSHNLLIADDNTVRFTGAHCRPALGDGGQCVCSHPIVFVLVFSVSRC